MMTPQCLLWLKNISKFMLNTFKASVITKRGQLASIFQQKQSVHIEEKSLIVIINGQKVPKKNEKHGRQPLTSVLFLIIFQVI